MTITGTAPLVYVYRVIPYDVHASKMITVNTKGPGFYELAKQTVKEYNYIYTGKNVDIINFDIYFDIHISIIYGWISFHSFSSYWLEWKLPNNKCILRLVKK